MGRLPYSKDEAHKCRNRMEQFVFSLKYMHTFEEYPPEFEKDPMLGKLADAARLANLTINQLRNYESSMRTEIDRWAEINFAKEQGEAKGRAETALRMKNRGYDPAEISECTGLSEEQIAALK